MRFEFSRPTVSELQADGVLLVEDGNHGEYRPRSEEFGSEGVAFIRAADMDGGRVLFESAERINERAMARIRKGIGRPGDVLLSHKGTVGKVSLAPDDAPPYICSPQTTFWRVLDPDRLDRHYLYAYLRSSEFRAQLASRKGETDMADYVSLTAQRQLKVPLPDIAVQREIGASVGALDDRISLVRQTNATLESIAHTLFKSWFIDFDPVRAKAEGREPEGMDASTAALFPAGFEESALGLIPTGWRSGTFSDLAEQAKGSVNPLGLPDAEFEHYSLPAFDADRLPVLERGVSIKSNKTRVPVGAVLQSKLNPHIPRIWLPSRVGERAVCSTEFLPWIAKGSVTSECVYCMLTAPSFEAAVRTLVTGTSNSHQRVKPDQIAALSTVVAPDCIYQAFTAVARPLLQTVGENRLRAKTLAEIRDSLLPRLISGKLRPPEALAMAEEAAIA